MRSFTVRSCLFLLLAVSAPAFALPAHYIVFQLDAHGIAQPMFHAEVDIDGVADVPVAQRRGSDTEVERVAWRPVHDGVAGALREIDVPRFLRAEFARDAESGTGEIDARAVENTDRAFVVRVAVADAESIELMTDAGSQQVDLVALAAASGSLPLASMAAQPFERTTPQASAANSGNRVDILVIGDGYTSAQAATFAAHVAALKTAMFAVTPYKEYANFVNWESGFVASTQSGADHPPYLAGCTATSCCADTAAQADAAAGTFVATALDARYCTSQIHRLLTVSSAKAFAAAAAYPGWDKLLVTVNDPLYGGAGGTFAVTSAASQAALIVIHEYGHSFQDLADEYSSAYPGFPACSDTTATPTCEANVTNETNPNLVKWRTWFTPGNPIPTPAGTSGVGLFQGARYLTSGMYRPVDNSCLMRVLGSNFCPVCRQEYVKTLYRGGFGVPVAGIDLIEPGSESPRPLANVPYAMGTTRTFTAALLRPTIGAVAIQWYLDGAPIEGATSESHAFTQASATPATRTLELRVTDTTNLVNATMADGLLVHSRTWTIQVGNDRLFADGFQ